jgi:hypothetical protein
MSIGPRTCVTWAVHLMAVGVSALAGRWAIGRWLGQSGLGTLLGAGIGVALMVGARLVLLSPRRRRSLANAPGAQPTQALQRKQVARPTQALHRTQTPPEAAGGPEFTIADPYAAVEGDYVKAQLHVHTLSSYDGEWSLEEAANHYASLGFSFLCVTDHGRVTVHEGQGPTGICVLGGEENTVPYPFWPLGRHLLRLFVSSHHGGGGAQDRIDSCVSQGGIVAIAHPSWTGNLGTGRWEVDQLTAISGYSLIEVRNLHSDEDEDTRVWHSVLAERMPEEPVWAVAVDDSRRASEAGRGWIQIKVPEVSSESLKQALLAGSFYATTGPECLFGVSGRSITATVDRPCTIRFINRHGSVVHETTGLRSASYAPRSDDGFVRIEVRDSDGKRAWSQPFALLPLPIRTTI